MDIIRNAVRCCAECDDVIFQMIFFICRREKKQHEKKNTLFAFLLLVFQIYIFIYATFIYFGFCCFVWWCYLILAHVNSYSVRLISGRFNINWPKYSSTHNILRGGTLTQKSSKISIYTECGMLKFRFFSGFDLLLLLVVVFVLNEMYLKESKVHSFTDFLRAQN